MVFGALALQTTINNDGSPLVAFGLLFRYFTIWTNFAAGVIFTLVALNQRVDRRVTFSLATAIAVVALVYHALLASYHHPAGLDILTNLAFHTVIPAATIAWWLAVTRRFGFAWGALPFAMIFPVIYTAFSLIYGEMTGFYPYFFTDKSTLSWGQLLVNIAGLALFFVVIGALLMTVRSGVGRLFKPSA